MRHRMLPIAVALAFALVPALEASAIEANFTGRAVVKYKEWYEDETKDKTKVEYDMASVDTSSSVSAVITLEPGLDVTYSVFRKSDRKGTIIPSVDPMVDWAETEDFINTLGGVGTAEVTDVTFKLGFQKINKKFKKNEFRLKLTGTYEVQDGPRTGEDVDFSLSIRMPKGKRVVF